MEVLNNSVSIKIRHNGKTLKVLSVEKAIKLSSEIATHVREFRPCLKCAYVRSNGFGCGNGDAGDCDEFNSGFRVKNDV